MRKSRRGFTWTLACSLAAGCVGAHAADAPQAATTPYIDVHAHLDAADIAGSIETTLKAMPVENLRAIIFQPLPFGPKDTGVYDAEPILAVAKKYPGKIGVLGGGGSLNPMLQQAAGTRDVPPDVLAKFKARAEELIREGALGFGEMTAEHFNGTTAYQSVAPDHPLLLALADIAAAHHATIDLHLEAVPHDMALPKLLKSPPNPPQLHESIAALERLLAHNPKAAIIWAHAGSENTGFRTPDLCRRLLAAHPNLYMEVKVDPVEPGLTPPLVNGATGAIRPEWLKLFQDFPDRFLVGTDQHYPEPKAAAQRWQAEVLLLNQLPAGLRDKISRENARRLYPKLK